MTKTNKNFPILCNITFESYTVFTAINNTKSKENRSKLNISPYLINYLTKIKFKICKVTFKKKKKKKH